MDSRELEVGTSATEGLRRDDVPTHDGGFTMDFSIDIVEDVPALVEEMMRLGALGYFKNARKLCDGVLARHTSTFAVAVECMRLLLRQGDFERLR